MVSAVLRDALACVVRIRDYVEDGEITEALIALDGLEEDILRALASANESRAWRAA